MIMHELRRKFTLFLTVLAVCAFTISTRADVVTDWNEKAVQATGTALRAVPTNTLDIGMVHAAMYDAIQAIEKDYEPYYVDIPNASGSSTAAAAKAARDVLVHLFPAQAASIDTQYVNYLIQNGIALDDPGIDAGATAAAGIILMRSCDQSFPTTSPAFPGGSELGMWRPTAPGFQNMLAPWLGGVTPFFITRQSQFRSDPPPPLTSRAFAKDYNEVKALGAKDGSSRTAAQTDMAHFYAGNPIAYWNRGLRDIADASGTSVSENSRLFALASMSIADAIIACWNEKKHYAFWRPDTAINNGDAINNPWITGDPTWTPLYANPPYPDHSSGANSVSGAVTRSLEHIFGKGAHRFSLTTTNLAAQTPTRNFIRFSQAADEMVEGRMLMGIHFRFPNVAGRKLGERVADYGFENYLKPVSGRRK